MSYDLFFTARREEANLTVASFAEFFRRRKNYQVSDQQAIYENEDTGVAFIFDFDDAEEGEPGGGATLSLNLNYWRPHVFGLEAETELSVLVRELDLAVGDPQGTMEDGEFNSEAFLRGWNEGNEFAYRSFLSNADFDDPFFTAPAAKIEAAWRWNLNKTALQEQLGEDIFVPTIMWSEKEGIAETLVVWGDGIPQAMPEVDSILIVREELAPKKFLRRKQDTSMATWAEVEPLIAEFPIESAALPYRALRYEEPPPHIVEFIKGLTASTGEIVPLERVLDLELVEKARGAA
jgi:hypothetical protein